MTDLFPAAFVLKAVGAANAEPPLLERVDVDGRVDGVLFTVTLRQTWRHGGERPLEVVYTFPLPPQALLLSFAALRSDQRLEGTILPRAQAEARYEAALERGDAPALLEVAAGGLHTASIGNLAPGETVVLEVQFTQLLRFEHGRLRLVAPTTVAPRYGQPAAAGLAPQQAPVSSVTAEYPLALALTIASPLAGARVDCPTHRHRIARGLTTRFELEPGARMDRDVVVVLWPVDQRQGLLVTAADPLAERPRQVALAAFELPRQPSNRPLSLKLLLDCSGSMAGDSMNAAQAALRGIADRLGADDEVALLRFGDDVQTALKPDRCNATTLRELRHQIESSTASMGGTEMAAALLAALALQHGHEQADVLLITDGQVWQSQVKAVAEAARGSGQRVFAIGVGSAPAEGALREITAATGGSCEFATPGDDLQAAALRMLERMRDTPWRGLHIDWGQPPQWQLPIEANAFGGDTVVAMAAFDGAAGPERVGLVLGGSGVRVEAVATAVDADAPDADEATSACDPELLARLLADHERRQQAQPLARATAVRYRLLTEHTHCVLVHQRSDAARDMRSADLVRVPSMLAAGWGGTGTVRAPDLDFSETASIYRFTGTVGASSPIQNQIDQLMILPAPVREDDSGPPLLSQRLFQRTTPGGVSDASLERLRELQVLLPAGDAQTLLGLWTTRQRLPAMGLVLLDALRALGLDNEDLWIVVVHWALSGIPAGAVTLPAWAQSRLDAIDPALLAQALEAVQATLAPVPGVKLSQRATRLLHALGL